MRERRPPPIFNSSPQPAPVKKVEKVEVKKARLDEVTAIPKPTDPSAFVQAAQQAKGGCVPIAIQRGISTPSPRQKAVAVVVK